MRVHFFWVVVCVCVWVCSKGSNLKLINWLSFIAKTTLSNESLYLYLVVYSTVYCLVAACAAAIQLMLTHPCIHIRTQLCETNSCKPVLNPLNLCALKAINSSTNLLQFRRNANQLHLRNCCDWMTWNKKAKQTRFATKKCEEFFEKNVHTHTHWKPNGIE